MNIPPYLGDLGVKERGWLVALRIPTLSSMLCLKRKYQTGLDVLVPGPEQ